MNFTATQQSVGWFRDRYAEGSLTIKPPYQRKPVWGLRQKCHLVESVLTDYPIPELFVQKATDEDGNTTYAVVDGQQRLRALLQYVGSDPTPDQAEFDRFSLDKLDGSSPWYQTSFAELGSADKKKFYGYELAVRYLNTDDEDELKNIFRRLNRYTVPLTAQELRNATFEGPFARVVEKLADTHTDFLAENRIVTAAGIRRMGDVELIAELLVGVMHGPQGGSAKSIDEFYTDFEDYDSEFPGQRKALASFEATLLLMQSVVDDFRTSRWGNKTDFYSLFVALAHFVKARRIPKSAASVNRLTKALAEFEAEIERRLEDDTKKARNEVVKYVRNVQKGANDKARRAERHAALLNIIEPLM